MFIYVQAVFCQRLQMPHVAPKSGRLEQSRKITIHLKSIDTGSPKIKVSVLRFPSHSRIVMLYVRKALRHRSGCQVFNPPPPPPSSTHMYTHTDSEMNQDFAIPLFYRWLLQNHLHGVRQVSMPRPDPELVPVLKCPI